MDEPLVDYEHHVFLSYVRQPLIHAWVVGLVERLRYRLTEDLGEPAKVFFDEGNIGAGDRITAKVNRAIQGSSCLVALWSAEYFRSRWCVSEWQSFVEREKIIDTESQGLVVPIRIGDGNHFPEAVCDVHCKDF